ncbi:MAG: M20/M25/M40 family metallo-hydrolase [Proteobacteria bacterium]|nr:M20/M25/M40 family metallo-hydrolase [Pseudomonadota bacterium]MDA0994652.1 M20/M25/M40 family metallo-hydrolase [Pseudomonadota bacterium]
MNRLFVFACAMPLLTLHVSAVAEDVDLDVIYRIKDQAFNHSRVMDYMHILADENGPRVTGSPGYRQAAEKAVAAYKDAEIDRAQLEAWGTFGRGWSWSRIAVQMKTPENTTLTAFPADWTAASAQPVSGEVVFAPLWDDGDEPRVSDLEKTAHQIEAYKEKYRGKLRGKIVMIDVPESFRLPDEPRTYRLDDEALADLAKAAEPGLKPPVEWPLVKWPADRDMSRRLADDMPLEIAADNWLLGMKLNMRLAAYWRDEGVAALLKTTWAEPGGVIMQSDFGSFIDGDPIAPPTATLMPEHYNRIHRLLEREVPVVIEVDIDAEFHGPGVDGINVIAEIPGANRRGEVVMLGAHLDSWHGATGATDNAAGSAVVMEAMRILKALDLDMDRTVRAALWDGEEQGLFGSRRYVENHFAEPISMTVKPDHAKLSAYFNLDNGGGKIRGVYLQKNDMARPILEAWLVPFADMGVAGATIINTHGTDHLSFNAVGLPGFNFVQDPLDYELNTHHSNLDHVDHIIAGDLMQAAAVMATAVYHAATRAEMMPRKPLPAPLPPKKELPAILQ